MKPAVNDLYDASKNKMDIKGTVTIKVQLRGIKKIISHEFYVLNKETYSTILLGRDFMEKLGPVTFDMRKGSVKIGSTWIKGREHRNKETVRLLENVNIPGRSEMIVTVKCKSSESLLTSNFQSSFKIMNGIYFSDARVIPNVNGCFNISVINVGDEDVTLNKRTVVGKVLPGFRNVMAINDNTTVDDVEFKLNSEQLGPNLSDKERNVIEKLVQSYKNVFASNPKRPSRSTTMQHEIETGDARPVYVKPRRIPEAWKQEVDEQVKQMLDNDIISPSTSEFSYTTNGEKDTYPLPNI